MLKEMNRISYKEPAYNVKMRANRVLDRIQNDINKNDGQIALVGHS